MVGDDVVVTIVDIRGDKVRLGISAPARIAVHRKEVYDAITRENAQAASIRTDELSQIANLIGPGPTRKGIPADGITAPNQVKNTA